MCVCVCVCVFVYMYVRLPPQGCGITARMFEVFVCGSSGSIVSEREYALVCMRVQSCTCVPKFARALALRKRPSK